LILAALLLATSTLFSGTVNRRSEWLKGGLHKQLLFMLLLMLQMAFSPVRSRADGGVQPEITVRVTPDSVLVGDRIRCTITVHPAEQEVAALEGFDKPDTLVDHPFELISQKHSSTLPLSGAGKEVFDFEFAVFSTGHQSLPPFTVVLRDAEGRVIKKIPCKPSASVFVRTLTDSSMHDLRPLKPPLKPSIPSLLIIAVVAGVFGVAGVVLLLLFLLKRTVRNSAERVDSGQVAQRKLRKLGSSLSAGMPPHECYEELSNIMRTFLENHYRIRALEAVTQEIERDLKKLGVAGFESIMNLLKQADLVKFADSRPDVEESRQSLQKASEVIRSTRDIKGDG
jgi:hypothetical protein